MSITSAVVDGGSRPVLRDAERSGLSPGRVGDDSFQREASAMNEVMSMFALRDAP